MKILKRKLMLSSLCAAVLTASPAYAEVDIAAEIQALKDRIKQLEEAQKKQPKIKATGAGLQIKGLANGATFKLNGRLHLDYNSFDGAYNGGNGGDTSSDFFARRARLGFSGNLNKNWSYQFVAAFGGGGSNQTSSGGSGRTDNESGRIQNAILSYNGFKNNGGPQIQLGKMKEDVTLEAVTSSNHITAISRPTIVNAVSPFFNWGVRVNQHFPESGLRYAFGVYQAADAGFTDGSGANDTGRDSGTGAGLIAYTGRVNWAPINEDNNVLHLGAWGSYRDFGGNELNDIVARGEVRNTETRLLQYGSDPDTDMMTQYGAEFAWVAGPFSLQAEYVEREVEARSSGGFEPDLDGYYAMVSYFPTGESRYYDAAKGVFKQPKKVRNAWEVYVRHSNADARNSFNGSDLGTEVEVLTLGVNYYVNPQLRFMLNYIDAEVDGSDSFISSAFDGEDDGEAITFRTHYMF